MSERQPSLAAAIDQAAASATLVPESPGDAHQAVATAKLDPCTAGLGPPIFVLAPESNHRVRAILDRLDRTGDRPVVLLHRHPADVRAVLESGDWRREISDPRVRWAVGGDGVAACRAAFDDDPGFWFLNASFIAGSASASAAVSDRSSYVGGFVADASEDLTRTVAELETLRRSWVEHRRRRPRLAELPPSEAPILATSDASTTALQYICRDLLHAASRRGHPTVMHLEHHAADPFRLHRRTRVLLETRPDVLVSPVQSGWQSFGELAAGLPTVVYYSSDPARYALDIARFAPEDHVFVADEAWTSLFRDRGVSVHVLPLATSLHDRSVTGDHAAWACDVAIVANLPEARDLLPDAAPELLDVVRRLGESLGDDATREAADIVAAASLEGATEDVLVQAVEVEATRACRIRAAILVAEMGIDLRIYGNEAWRDAVAGTPAAAAYRRSIDYVTEVPSAYRHARVVLNVGTRTAREALNMRAFDVPAVGGCLVTDARPGVDQAFVPGQEVMVYVRLEEIPDVIRRLLDNPVDRDRIARAGQARVLGAHTYDQRWDRIWDTLTKGA